MCIKIFTATFLIFAAILTIQLLALLFGITNKMKPMRSSDFISSVTAVMLFYVVNALILVILYPNILSKAIILLFALVPFIIGKFAVYKHLKIFSIIQIVCVIISGVYVLII